jgi:hypothetical protein
MASLRKPASQDAAPSFPEVKVDGQHVEPTVAVSVEHQRSGAELDAAFKERAEPPKEDPTLALQKQIEELRKSEEIQRQRHAAMAHAQAHPPTREQKLELWRSQGMSDTEAEFLRANPELIDMPELTAFAANEAARQGHGRGTEAHMNATREIFRQHLAHLQTQAAPAPEPAFFAPSLPPEPPAADRSSLYAAPVSRETPSGGYREPIPSRIILSAEEKSIAAAAGISDVAYAKNKMRLAHEKANGERQ